MSKANVKKDVLLDTYTGLKINLDKHDLFHTFNSIYLSLETAKDKLNFEKNIKEAIRLIDEAKEKLEKFLDEGGH